MRQLIPRARARGQYEHRIRLIRRFHCLQLIGEQHRQRLRDLRHFRAVFLQEPHEHAGAVLVRGAPRFCAGPHRQAAGDPVHLQERLLLRGGRKPKQEIDWLPGAEGKSQLVEKRLRDLRFAHMQKPAEKLPRTQGANDAALLRRALPKQLFSQHSLKLCNAFRHRPENCLVALGFQQKAHARVFQRRIGVFKFLKRREEDDAAGRPVCPHPLHQLDTADRRHADIREQNVDAPAVHNAERLRRKTRLVHLQLHGVLLLEQRAEPFHNHRLVVHNQDAIHENTSPK